MSREDEDQTLPGRMQRVAAALRARGHPHAVFKLQPRDLARLTGAPVADVVELAAGSP